MNIVFLMNTGFPYGEAYSSRARNITKLLCYCNHHVHIIAPKTNNNLVCDEMVGLDYTCEYVIAPRTKLTLTGIGTAKPYMNALRKHGTSNRVDLVLSSSMVFVNGKIQKFCKQKGIPYIVEQCEWFDESTFRGGKLNPYYREHIYLIKKKNKYAHGVIAISRLLEQHYCKQGVKVIRIPTILDIENTKITSNKSREKLVHMVFAGSIGKGKEKFEPVFLALKRINHHEKKIVLDLYGPNESQVLENINGNHDLLDSVRDFVFVHGRIPQNEIETIIRDAEFSIFVRPNRQSSKAGFPTKLAESMAVGTPVITNDTGDVGLYIESGVNGFLMSSGDEDEVFKVLSSIINMDQKQMSEMRSLSRKTAEESFDYRIYEEEVQKLLYKV